MVERFGIDELDEQEIRMRKFAEVSARGFISAIQDLKTEHMHKVSMVGDFSLNPEKEQSTRELLEKNPKDPYGWWILGHTLLKREEFDEALKCLKKSAKQFRQAPYVWRDIGIIHKRTGNIIEASHALKKSIELESPMVDPEALYEMAGILMYEENYIRALELLDVQKAHTPEDTKMWKHIGHCAMRLGHMSDAIRVYEWVISKDSEDSEVWRHLGFLFSIQEEWTQAEKSLRRANQLLPDDFEISMNFGGLFHSTDRSKTAVKSYRKATRLQPENPRPWLAMGAVYLEMGEFAKSHSAFARVLELDPESEIAAAGMLDAENARRM